MLPSGDREESLRMKDEIQHLGHLCWHVDLEVGPRIGAIPLNQLVERRIVNVRIGGQLVLDSNRTLFLRKGALLPHYMLGKEGMQEDRW
jgi:hypothetical protein